MTRSGKPLVPSPRQGLEPDERPEAPDRDDDPAQAAQQEEIENEALERILERYRHREPTPERARRMYH